MKMRKLFAGLAAAATLLSGMALGAGTAYAAGTPVTDNATFTFTSESADQWGKNNNRQIKAYKIGDFVKSGDETNGFVYTVETPATPTNASTTLKNALNKALEGAGTGGANVTVPNDQDPLAWALSEGWLDSSATKPYVADNPTAKGAGVTRKLADALQAAEKDKADDQADFTVKTLKVGANTNNNEVELTPATGQTAGTATSYTATLPAGFYLFLDVTTNGGNIADGTQDDQNKSNDNQTPGKVVVNSAPMIVSSGQLGTDANAGKITSVTASNTVNFKNHVTPVTKSHDDADNSVSEGQIVRYTLQTTFPAFTTGHTDYEFSLKDYPGVGQTVNLDGFKNDSGQFVQTNAGAYEVKVYGADASGKKTGTGTDLAANKYTLTTSTTQQGAAVNKIIEGAANAWFNFDFNNLVRGTDYQTQYAGKIVEVTYAVKITAKTNPVTNKVEVNDNNSVASDSTSLSVGKFSFKKVDAEGNALGGATFTITAKNPTPNNTNANAVTPETQTATSAQNTGVVTFEGLAYGTYEVEETGVPTGFLQNAKAKFEVTLTDKGATFKGTDVWGLAPKDSPATGSDYTVKNVKNITQLPLTGAAGTVLFTVVALLLAGAAVTVSLKSRATKRALRA